MVQPRVPANCSASPSVKNGPIGLLGWANAGSLRSTTMWVTTETAPEISRPQTSCRARQIRLPRAPWVIAPRENSGCAGTSRAPSSCWIARLPTCGPFPWTMMICQPLRNSDRTDLAMAKAFEYCSSTVPRWSSRVRALPPRAMTAISLMYGSLSGGGLPPDADGTT